LAVAGVRALRLFGGPSLPGAERVELNAPVLIFATALTLATGILFGIVPAILAARRASSEGLGHGARGTADRTSRRALRACRDRGGPIGCACGRRGALRAQFHS